MKFADGNRGVEIAVSSAGQTPGNDNSACCGGGYRMPAGGIWSAQMKVFESVKEPYFRAKKKNRIILTYS